MFPSAFSALQGLGQQELCLGKTVFISALLLQKRWAKIFQLYLALGVLKDNLSTQKIKGEKKKAEELSSLTQRAAGQGGDSPGNSAVSFVLFAKTCQAVNQDPACLSQLFRSAAFFCYLFGNWPCTKKSAFPKDIMNINTGHSLQPQLCWQLRPQPVGDWMCPCSCATLGDTDTVTFRSNVSPLIAVCNL